MAPTKKKATKATTGRKAATNGVPKDNRRRTKSGRLCKKPGPKPKPGPRDTTGRLTYNKHGKQRVKKPVDRIDELDGKIIAGLLLDEKPNWSQLAREHGVANSTVFRRIHGIKGGTLLLTAKRRFSEMLPLVSMVYLERLLAGDLDAAKQIAFGTGVLSNHQDIHHSGLESGDPNAIARFLIGLDSGTFNKVIAAAIEHIAKGGDGSTDGSDASVVGDD